MRAWLKGTALVAVFIGLAVAERVLERV